MSDAEREQHGLEDVRALVAEPEQDRERPAAGKRRAEHLGADQDRGAEMTVMTLGQTIWRADGGGAFMAHGVLASRAAISPKRRPGASAKGPKKPHRVL